jgi:hypothetical protein
VRKIVTNYKNRNKGLKNNAEPGNKNIRNYMKKTKNKNKQ